jgi:hypothetical protein
LSCGVNRKLRQLSSGVQDASLPFSQLQRRLARGGELPAEGTMGIA